MEQAFYFPITNGRYDVAPGLRPFGYDFGNGSKDKLVFQFDGNYENYRREKLAARRESLEKYYCRAGDKNPKIIPAILKFIIGRLVSESSEFFQLKQEGPDTGLSCLLSGEKLFFNEDMEFLPERSSCKTTPSYKDGLDALASQVQEDLAIWRQDLLTGREWLEAAHLCFPNHWDPREKVGKSFMEVHAPVAHFDRMKSVAPVLVKGMVARGPFVRFAWGVSTDRRLNHHPEPPSDISSAQWKGRSFNPTTPELYLRVERQTLHPFPEEGAALFTIRTYFYDCRDWPPGDSRLQALFSAIQSMSPKALEYKGLSQDRDALLKWLSARTPAHGCDS